MTVAIFAGGVVAMTVLLALFFKAVAAPVKDGETVYGALMRSVDAFARQMRPAGDDSEDPDYDAPSPTTPRGSPMVEHEDPPTDDGEEEEDEEDDVVPEEEEEEEVARPAAPPSDSASIAERIRQRRKSRGRGVKVLVRNKRSRERNDDK